MGPVWLAEEKAHVQKEEKKTVQNIFSVGDLKNTEKIRHVLRVLMLMSLFEMSKLFTTLWINETRSKVRLVK